MWKWWRGISIEMSRINDKFLELKSRNEKGLIAYTVAGYPSYDGTLAVVRGLVKGGADIIELGLPFSDPLADGPVIQNASFNSLKKGMKFERFVKLVKRIREESEIPLVVMTYTNLLYSTGYKKFMSTVKKAGIDGLILPDMAIEEAEEYLDAVKKYNLDAVFLISPNTTEERIRKIAKASSGFLYLVSVFGTTGTKQEFQQYTLNAIKKAKRIVDGRVPLGVGFGVTNANQARSILQSGADAVIVGSAFIRSIERIPPSKIESTMASFTKSLKDATLSHKK